MNSFSLQVVTGEVADDADAEERAFQMTLNAISVQMQKEVPEDACGKQKEGKGGSLRRE
jgi:hypothetical protein